MAYEYPEIRNFLGLFLQRNSFATPDGALEVAQNAVISRDGIVTKSRGFYTYYSPGAPVLNRLFFYQSKLLSAYAASFNYYTDTGSSPNETGTQTALVPQSGLTIAITGDRVSRSVLSNNNFYATTDNGVVKLTAYNSLIAKSGAPQGLDLSAMIVPSAAASTWFSLTAASVPVSAIVGYRILFGYQDANDNLIIGAPSSVATISNPVIEGSTWARSGGGPYTVTVTTTSPHGLATGMWLDFFAAAGGGAPTAIEGTYQITVTTATAFTYSVVVDPGAAGTQTVKYVYQTPVELELSIPTEITADFTWFFEVYRSSIQQTSVGVLSDYELIEHRNITAGELSAHVAFFTDDTDDFLRGAELYTNENSREGEAQANYRAPLCVDMALFYGYVIYANCTTRHFLSFAVVDATALVTGVDWVEIKVDSTTRRYGAYSGLSNNTVTAPVTSSAGLLITYAAHKLLNNFTVYISQVTGGALTVGTYYVVAATTNNFKISLTSGGAAIAYGGETQVQIQGVTDGTGPIFYLSDDADAAIRLQDTASGLVKAINRDPSSLIYAQYSSSASQVPGHISLQAKAFTGTISLRANVTLAGTAFSPVLPTSFSVGPQVTSSNDRLPHGFFVAKQNEPEAVPLVNFFLAGAKNKAILRCHALRDSLILEKEDGVYRVTGDSINNFVVTLLDSTVAINASSSSDVLNNQCVFLSNQGICLVTDSTVQIISRRIEEVIQPILGQTNLSAVTGGVAYESERLYLLTTSDPNNLTATVTYAYNILSDAWTTLDVLFKQGVVGPNDTLYVITTLNEIWKERKKQTNLDYSAQNYPVTITAISSDLKQADVQMPVGVTPEKGDIVVKANVINRISLPPVLSSGTTYTCIFRQATNLLPADTPILYSKYQTIIKTAPFHAGLVGKWKHFAEMQVHQRDQGMSALTITFAGAVYGSSEITEWVALNDYSGWGYFPWGFEPWGQQEGINLSIGTTPAPIMRTYVPQFQARNTFIQPYLVHNEAGEPLNIQSLSFAVRPYGQRVSR